MAKRIRVKAGDFFKIPVHNGEKCRFFQFIREDEELLMSDMVRVFNLETDKDSDVKLEEIINSGILFFSHTMIKIGLKFCEWERIDNLPIEADFEEPLFIYTEDYGSPTPVDKSYKWWLRKGSKRTFLGALPEQNKNIPYDGSNHPVAFTKMVELGYDYGKYPA